MNTERQTESKKIAAYIEKARYSIETLGWDIQEEVSSDGKMLHLVLIKGAQRLGWGMFEPIYCWTKAYEAVSGNNFINLLDRD